MDTKMPTGDDANTLWGMIAAAFTTELAELAGHLEWTLERTTAAMASLVEQGFVGAATLGTPAHRHAMITLVAYASEFHDSRPTGETCEVEVTGPDWQNDIGQTYRPVSEPVLLRRSNIGCGSECMCGGGSLIAEGLGHYQAMASAILLDEDEDEVEEGAQASHRAAHGRGALAAVMQ